MRSNSSKKLWSFSIVLFLCTIALAIYWTPAFADNPIPLPLPIYGTETQPWSNATDEVSSAFSSAPVTESGFGTAPLPAEFSLLSPSHKAHFVQKTDYLVWTQISGAKWYRLHILGKNKTNVVKRKFKDIDVICFNGVCSIPLTSLEMTFDAGQNYQWWVVAKVEGEKIKTNKWKFQLPSSDETLHVASAELPFLYSEDFDGEVLSDIWYDRIYAVKSLQGDNTAYHVLGQMPITLPQGYIKDVALEAKVTLYGGRAILVVRGSGAGHYYAALNSTGEVELYKGDTIFAKSPQNLSIVPGQQYQLRISVIGNHITVTVDGSPIISITDPNPLPYGVATIGGDALKRNDVYIDDIQLYGTIADEPLRGIDLIAPLAQWDDSSTRNLGSGNERIYFRRHIDDVNTTIYSADPTDVLLGQDEIRMRFGNALDPAVSPDGTRLAFYSTFDGSGRIYIKHRDDGSVDGVNGSRDRYPSWTRKSDSVYYRDGHPDNDVSGTNIFTQQAATGGCHTGFFSSINDIAMSPDGSAVAVRLSNSLVIISIVPYDCGDQLGHQYFIYGSQHEQFASPAWSQDGKFLAFSAITVDQNTGTITSQIKVKSVTRTVNNGTFAGFAVTDYASITAPGAPNARRYVSPTWSQVEGSTYKLAFIEQSLVELDSRVVFATVSAQGITLSPQHVDNAYGSLSWGQGVFKAAYPQCISVKSLTDDLEVRQGPGMEFQAPHTLNTDERFLAIGRRIVGADVWLRVKELYDVNGEIITHVDYNNRPVINYGSLWVLATDANLDLDSAGDACDDDRAVNDPSKAYADDVYYLPLLNPPTATPTYTPTPASECSVALTLNGKLREGPGTKYNEMQIIPAPTVLTLIGKTEVDNESYSWYRVGNPAGWMNHSVLDAVGLNKPECVALPLYNIVPTITPPYPTPTLLPPLPTATRGITSTPLPTPTEALRIVPTEAMPFQEMDDRVGLPLPFEIWPLLITPTADNRFQQGFGANGQASEDCLSTLVPTSTPAPESATPTPVSDPCQYRNTSGIHTGLDYYSKPSNIIVIALCNGVIVPAHERDNGGSAAPGAKGGLALRCFADDPADPDNNGWVNLSNVVISYNHIDLSQGVQTNSYQVVRAGQKLGETTMYDKPDNIHLHLEAFLAKNFRDKSQRIVLNPLMTYSADLVAEHKNFLAYTEDNIWTLQGMRWAAGYYWTDPTDTHNFIRDIATALATQYSTSNVYTGPNCVNIPSDIDKNLLGRGDYLSCELVGDDGGPNAAPTLLPFTPVPE